MLPETELEPRAENWIGELLLNGEPIELDRVLASVQVRHGRDDVNGPIQSSTATLRLRNLDRAELEAWEVGGRIALSDVAAAPVYTGTLTDSRLVHDDPAYDSVLEVIAVSTLASAGERSVAGHAWPAETWQERAVRILTEAGYTAAEYEVQAGPVVQLAATVPDDPEAGTYAETNALDALEELRNDIGATAFDHPDGRIFVQAFDARKGLYAEVELEPERVAYSPQWAMVLDVANRIVLGYGHGAGTVTVNDPVSQERYGVHWTGSFDTGLADQATAHERATAWLGRVSFPRWKLPSVTLLEPRFLSVGQLVRLTELPATAPFASYAAVVEGWVDNIEGPVWSQELLLSDPIFSGLGLLWLDLPAELLWQAVNPEAHWRDAFTLSNLEPIGA